MGSDGKLGEGHVGFEITMEHAERRPGGRGRWVLSSGEGAGLGWNNRGRHTDGVA